MACPNRVVLHIEIISPLFLERGSILIHFHLTNMILLVATFYHIMLLCSPHRTATPSTQEESDSPASERQLVTQVEETDHDQTRYKVHSDCSFTST